MFPGLITIQLLKYRYFSHAILEFHIKFLFNILISTSNCLTPFRKII